MRLNTLLEYLFLEHVSGGEEAPAHSPLGKYLFAPQRKDTPTPKEPNTDLENKIQAALSNHYSGGDRGAVGEVEAGIMKLFDMKKRGLYLKLLDPPSGLAYRFMKNITPEKVSTAFFPGLSVDEITSSPNKAFYVPDVGLVAKPNASTTILRGAENLSSWTVEPDLKAFETFLSTTRDLCSIVLVADIQSNDFIMNPKQLSKSLSYDSDMPFSLIGREQEVIALGPVNVICGAVYYYKSGPPRNYSYAPGNMVQAELLRAVREKM